MLGLPRVPGAETTGYSCVPGAPNAEMTGTRWYWYSDDLCNIVQMLPAPGSKVKYFREKYISGTSCTRSTSGLFPWNIASTRSISRFSTADTFGHEAFRGSILWILPVFEEFQGSVLRILHVLVAFRPWVLRVLGVLY